MASKWMDGRMAGELHADTIASSAAHADARDGATVPRPAPLIGVRYGVTAACTLDPACLGFWIAASTFLWSLIALVVLLL